MKLGCDKKHEKAFTWSSMAALTAQRRLRSERNKRAIGFAILLSCSDFLYAAFWRRCARIAA